MTSKSLTSSYSIGVIAKFTFESGDLSEWDYTYVRNGMVFESAASCSHTGSYGLHIRAESISNSNPLGYLDSTHDANATAKWITFDIRVNEKITTSNSDIYFSLYSGSQSIIEWEQIDAFTIGEWNTISTTITDKRWYLEIYVDLQDPDYSLIDVSIDNIVTWGDELVKKKDITCLYNVENETLINGDFETGDFTGWDITTYGSGSITVGASYAHSGNYGMCLTGEGISLRATTDVYMPIGKLVQFDYKIVSLTPDQYGNSLYVGAAENSGSLENIVMGTSLINDGEWHTYSHTIVTKDCTYITAAFAGGGVGVVYFDNFTTDVPYQSITSLYNIVPYKSVSGKYKINIDKGIVNGNFDDGITGWGVTSGSGNDTWNFYNGTFGTYAYINTDQTGSWLVNELYQLINLDNISTLIFTDQKTNYEQSIYSIYLDDEEIYHSVENNQPWTTHTIDVSGHHGIYYLRILFRRNGQIGWAGWSIDSIEIHPPYKQITSRYKILTHKELSSKYSIHASTYAPVIESTSYPTHINANNIAPITHTVIVDITGKPSFIRIEYSDGNIELINTGW